MRRREKCSGREQSSLVRRKWKEILRAKNFASRCVISHFFFIDAYLLSPSYSKQKSNVHRLAPSLRISALTQDLVPTNVLQAHRHLPRQSDHPLFLRNPPAHPPRRTFLADARLRRVSTRRAEHRLLHPGRMDQPHRRAPLPATGRAYGPAWREG